MKPNKCKNCGSSNLRALYSSGTDERWIGCDSCGNASTPTITNNGKEIIALWNKEQEKSNESK